MSHTLCDILLYLHTFFHVLREIWKRICGKFLIFIFPPHIHYSCNHSRAIVRKKVQVRWKSLNAKGLKLMCFFLRSVQNKIITYHVFFIVYCRYVCHCVRRLMISWCWRCTVVLHSLWIVGLAYHLFVSCKLVHEREKWWFWTECDDAL